MELTLDTHTFVWSLEEKLNKKIPVNTLRTIKEVERKGIIYIPTIVLMEILHLTEKGKIDFSLNKALNVIESSYNYQVVPLDLNIVKISEL